jgi:hypothetical protein
MLIAFLSQFDRLGLLPPFTALQRQLLQTFGVIVHLIAPKVAFYEFCSQGARGERDPWLVLFFHLSNAGSPAECGFVVYFWRQRLNAAGTQYWRRSASASIAWNDGCSAMARNRNMPSRKKRHSSREDPHHAASLAILYAGLARAQADGDTEGIEFAKRAIAYAMTPQSDEPIDEPLVLRPSRAISKSRRTRVA